MYRECLTKNVNFISKMLNLTKNYYPANGDCTVFPDYYVTFDTAVKQ